MVKLANKAKCGIIVCLVFVFSFILTVNACADWTIENKNYFGTYRSNLHNEGFVKVSEKSLSIFAYHDANFGYVSGTSYDGALTSSNYAFTFDIIRQCSSDGTSSNNATKYYGKTLCGKTTVKTGGFLGLSIKSITLSPDYITGEYYVYKK